MNATDYSVCVDCYLTAAGYDSHELGHTPAHEPLALISGHVVVACTCDGPTVSDGHADFGTAPCEGCGSTLAGERHNVTALEQLDCASLFGEHSDDRVDVYRGRTTPDLFCGRHAGEL